MTNLALAYMKGQGVIRNTGDAVKWFKESALRGDAVAEYHLATMHASGVHFSKNDEKAFDLMQKSQKRVWLPHSENWQCFIKRVLELKTPTTAFEWF